ncbi:hypothetical protein H0H87_002010 [Tephrocybe sp. NHM501043]|nr:hypothetical protein H0H87_002010 [Tephrocybe sp. NHM501043]
MSVSVGQQKQHEIAPSAALPSAGSTAHTKEDDNAPGSGSEEIEERDDDGDELPPPSRSKGAVLPPRAQSGDENPSLGHPEEDPAKASRTTRAAHHTPPDVASTPRATRASVRRAQTPTTRAAQPAQSQTPARVPSALASTPARTAQPQLSTPASTPVSHTKKLPGAGKSGLGLPPLNSSEWGFEDIKLPPPPSTPKRRS